MTTLRNRYGLKNFVETGTAGGHTAITAATLFDRVCTIEIDWKTPAHPDAKQYANLQQYHGASETVLPEILETLAGPTLFYLDAHWSGGPKLGPECPVVEELQAILKHDAARECVIFVDDARLFIQPPPPPHEPTEWPDMATLRNLVGDRYCFQLLGDLLVLTPEPILEVVSQ